MAKSLDGFYQESGRGGRDGKPSLSLLYYSKDDAATFAYLLKMNAEKEAKKKGKRYQKVDHSLMELEGMVNYCIKPNCKRKYVLGHFGEDVAESICKKTCDFCIDPRKVERDIQASHCMSDVVNSNRMMRARNDDHENDGKKYHHDPLADEGLADDHGSEDDYLGNDEGLLGIKYHLGDDEFTPSSTITKQKGFAKASDVLSKYEAMEYEATECQLGKRGGFVNYKTRSFDKPRQDEEPDAKRYRTVNIPDHLRSSMPDPLEAHKKAPSATTSGGLKSSSSYASESERLRAEIEELRNQKDAAQGNIPSRASATILTAPSLSFKKNGGSFSILTSDHQINRAGT
jgi:superfamily II DNA helicase RecQ